MLKNCISSTSKPEVIVEDVQNQALKCKVSVNIIKKKIELTEDKTRKLSKKSFCSSKMLKISEKSTKSKQYLF